MNKTLKNKVIAVAKRAREWALEEAAYDTYNKFDLCEWCAIASGKLHTELLNERVNATINVTESYLGCHAYVVVDDHIVDITATQFREFNDKPIVIMHLKEAEQFWYYVATDMFTSAKDLRKHQLKVKWPRKQLAYKEY